MESEHYHLGEIKATGENVEIATWATTAANLKNAVWKPLFQLEKTCQFTIGATGRKRKARVMDIIPTEQSDGYIGMRNVAMNASKKIATTSLRQIKRKRIKHHRLGTTFP